MMCRGVRSLVLTGFLILGMCLPLFGSGSLERGERLEREGKWQEALDCFLAAMRERPPREEAFKKAGALLGKLKRYGEAQKLVAEGIRQFPESVSLRNLQGMLYLATGQSQQARQCWQDVLARDPKNAYAQEKLTALGREAPAGSHSSGDASPQTMPIDDGRGHDRTSLSLDLPPASPSLPLAEQESLAAEIFAQLKDADDWDLESFIAGYQKVITQCPQTVQAQIACWRLANLYLNAYPAAYGEPNYEGIIKSLEHLLHAYPESPIALHARHRLLFAYEQAGRFEKVAEILQKHQADFADDADDDQCMVWALMYADALAKLGKTSEAKRFYEEVITRDRDRNDFKADIARRRLADLPGEGGSTDVGAARQ